LRKVIKFADSSNVDFVVLLGDIADDGKNKTYDIAKNIIQNSTKPYYTVAGNHDVKPGPASFEAHFGSEEHLENVKGYQFIFPGLYYEGENKLHWSFNFSIANTSAPTLVFMHGPTVKPPADIKSCNWGPDFFGYGQSMEPELNKFPNLVAEFSGHVHYDTDQTINGIRYVTVNGLVDKAGGCDNEGPSPYIGYSRIKDGKVDYTLVDYNGQFKDPFPDK
jgi:predicted phosphodiesterase